MAHCREKPLRVCLAVCQGHARQRPWPSPASLERAPLQVKCYVRANLVLYTVEKPVCFKSTGIWYQKASVLDKINKHNFIDTWSHVHKNGMSKRSWKHSLNLTQNHLHLGWSFVNFFPGYHLCMVWFSANVEGLFKYDRDILFARYNLTSFIACFCVFQVWENTAVTVSPPGFHTPCLRLSMYMRVIL